MILSRSSYFSLFTLFLLFIVPSPQHADNHFNWQTLESGMLKVHWYEGDADFGQAAMEAAQAGLESIGRYLPSRLEQTAEIFIYASTADLQSELGPGIENWIAGHADPAQGVVRVVVEPGSEQGIVMEQRIPHELMHVMLYRQVGAGYQTIPAWLREGMAILAEVYPNADYDSALADATQNNRLIPLKDLCISFPSDTGQAFLAYAEARSFTDYLHDTYGSTGLLNLAASYADGVDCEHGPERIFGVSLAGLESQWRSSALGQNTTLVSLQNILPYLVLLCLVLIIPLFGVVSTLCRKGTRNEPGIRSKR
jgi:hypothetical protein